jgi:long-chain fatty acid transport protein
MTFKQTAVRAAAALALGAALIPAHATNGYFAHGYGIKAKGMGGAGVALAQDGFAGANNPAQSAFAGNRYDVGVDLFMPDRSASFGAANSKSGDTEFLIPEFGYNNTINDQMSFGLTVYGNGGMNTNYPAGGTNVTFGDPGSLGMDLMQLIVAPTFAFKLSKDHAIGISPLLVYQKFKAQGLQNMRVIQGGNPGVNVGGDSSNGVGVRLGYLGNLTDQISLGASYSPKINMSKFDKYSWLFLEQGDFDIPENYSVGAAFKATPEVTVALDYQRINYNKVRSIGQPMTAGGFGWSNVDVYKLGIEWKMNQATTLRAGYSWGTNPVSAPNAQFNILAPGVIKDHLTLGATYALSAESEMSVAYMHGFKNSVSGQGSPDGRNFVPVNIEMKQNSLGIQYSRQF